jgi:hypothetical protein
MHQEKQQQYKKVASSSRQDSSQRLIGFSFHVIYKDAPEYSTALLRVIHS